MIVDEATRALIDEHVATLQIEQWAPLSSAERDLIRRTLTPAHTTAAGAADAA